MTNVWLSGYGRICSQLFQKCMFNPFFPWFCPNILQFKRTYWKFALLLVSTLILMFFQSMGLKLFGQSWSLWIWKNMQYNNVIIKTALENVISRTGNTTKRNIINLTHSELTNWYYGWYPLLSEIYPTPFLDCGAIFCPVYWNWNEQSGPAIGV